jgi:hypothetical protein
MIENFTNGSLLLQFGTGDISICYGGTKKEGAVMFRQQDPQEIGAQTNLEGPHSAYVGEFPLTMLFSKPESVDVLIQSLIKVKALMENRR